MGEESVLVLALDVIERERAINVLESVKNEIAFTKLNWPIILSCGEEIISDVKNIAKKPVIADLKLADIDNTLRLITEEIFAAGADYIIAHPFIGNDPLQVIPRERLILVVEMSHPGATQFIQAHTEEFCKMAEEIGVFGVIAPATRPERVEQIRKWVGEKIKIFCPGVGAQGGTASEVIRSGADYIIVGRSIYNSENPKESAKRILKNIR